ncbi:MAG: hypothetical protein AB1714_17690 [Acidobacteriota bacterium]
MLQAIGSRCQDGDEDACRSLALVARDSEEPDARWDAVEYLRAEQVLAQVAMEESLPGIREAALAKLSGLILDTFWRRLNGLPLEVEKQLAPSVAYWRQQTTPDPARCPSCKRRSEMTLSRSRQELDDQEGAVHYGRCCREGTIWGSNVDLGWFTPEGEQLEGLRRALAGSWDPCNRKD